MNNSFARTRPGLGVFVRLLLMAYVGAVILFSFREGLTIGAKLLGVVLGIGFILLAKSSGRPIYVPTMYRIWLVWLFLAIVSAVQASSIGLAVIKIVTLIQIVLVGFMLTNYLLWNGSTRFYWLTIMAATLVSSAMVWMSPATFSDWDGRVVGTLGNANAYGALLVTGLIITLVGAIDSNERMRKVLFFAATAVFFLMVLKTGSRQAVLGSFVGGATVLGAYLLQVRRRRLDYFLLAMIVIVAMIVIAVTYVSSSEFWPRIQNAIDAAKSMDVSGADTSLKGRLWLYARAWEVAVDNPFSGIGLDNFRSVTGVAIGLNVGTYTHSNYMEILVSTGFPGFLVYFSMYFLVLRQLLRSRKLIHGGQYFGSYTRVLALFVALVVMDFTSVSYYSKVMWIVFPWVIAELVMMDSRHVRSRTYG